jgi:hypothetical protein
LLVSASNVDAYAMHAADGRPTRSDVHSSRIRRGSSATAAMNPTVSAPHAPRENVKYSVMDVIGTAAAAANASCVRLA